MPKKVKSLDDDAQAPLVDHVGLRLWRATQLWQERFRHEMVSSGYPWFGEARAALIPHIDRGGTSQSDLTSRIGLTKQAVQQLIDNLVQDGVVERRTDSSDARVRRICFTKHGLRVLADANDVKRRIEAEYAQALGAATFDRLNAALEQLLRWQCSDPAPRSGTSK